MAKEPSRPSSWSGIQEPNTPKPFVSSSPARSSSWSGPKESNLPRTLQSKSPDRYGSWFPKNIQASTEGFGIDPFGTSSFGG